MQLAVLNNMEVCRYFITADGGGKKAVTYIRHLGDEDPESVSGLVTAKYSAKVPEPEVQAASDGG
jgi:hypothetical protein